ncbi:MAG: folate family ECF transporter S component [Clostridiales bacterium]|nr:folate family ECF transporter S component [Clostridiales bacterium]
MREQKREAGLFAASARWLREPRALALAALFVAISVTLDLLNVRIQITPQLRITFGYLCDASIGMLFGPVVGMASGVCTDVLGYLMNTGGGAYFPGYTLTAIAGGLIYGVTLYHPSERKGFRLLRCFIAKGLINLLCNMLLNTFWLSLTGGDGFLVLLPLRAVKNALLWPIESLLLYFVLETVLRISLRFPALRQAPRGGVGHDL